MSEEKVSFILGPYSAGGAGLHAGGGPLPGRRRRIANDDSSDHAVLLDRFDQRAEGFGKAYADAGAVVDLEGREDRNRRHHLCQQHYGQVVSSHRRGALTAQGVKGSGIHSGRASVKDMTPIVLRVKSLAPDAVISVVYFQDGMLLPERASASAAAPIWLGSSAGQRRQAGRRWEPRLPRRRSPDSFGLLFRGRQLPG